MDQPGLSQLPVVLYPPPSQVLHEGGSVISQHQQQHLLNATIGQGCQWTLSESDVLCKPEASTASRSQTEEGCRWGHRQEAGPLLDTPAVQSQAPHHPLSPISPTSSSQHPLLARLAALAQRAQSRPLTQLPGHQRAHAMIPAAASAVRSVRLGLPSRAVAVNTTLTAKRLQLLHHPKQQHLTAKEAGQLFKKPKLAADQGQQQLVTLITHDHQEADGGLHKCDMSRHQLSVSVPACSSVEPSATEPCSVSHTCQAASMAWHDQQRAKCAQSAGPAGTGSIQMQARLPFPVLHKTKQQESNQELPPKVLCEPMDCEQASPPQSPSSPTPPSPPPSSLPKVGSAGFLCRQLLRGHREAVGCVAWQPHSKESAHPAADERLVCSSREGSLWVRNVCRGGALVDDLPAGFGVYSAAWSQDGGMIAAAGTSFVKLFHRVETGFGGRPIAFKEATTFADDFGPHPSLKWQPLQGSYQFAVNSGKECRLFTFDPGSQTVTLVNRLTGALQAAKETLRDVAYNPASPHLLAVASADGLIVVYDVISGQPTVMKQAGRGLTGVSWSPCGGFLVAAGERGRAAGSLRLIPMRAEAAAHAFGSKSKSTSVAWAPSSGPAARLLACGQADGSVHLYNMKGQRLVGVLQGHTKEVTTMAWSPDGKKLATGSKDGSVRVWMHKSVR